MHTIQNNFNNLKDDFKKDTGKNADDNIELYIAYFNARMTDRIMQTNHIMVNELANGLHILPDAIVRRMAEMITALKKDGKL
ncbi:hypothetical protein [Mucilaginibacter sp. 3215]|uniref:hypothetical protein n=1 Tax=Mucilaginibacter sp. 3215 TaxID=3373912 RepID=UPI003D25C473